MHLTLKKVTFNTGSVQSVMTLGYNGQRPVVPIHIHRHTLVRTYLRLSPDVFLKRVKNFYVTGFFLTGFFPFFCTCSICSFIYIYIYTFITVWTRLIPLLRKWGFEGIPLHVVRLHLWWVVVRRRSKLDT